MKIPIILLMASWCGLLLFMLAQQPYEWPLWIKVLATIALGSLTVFSVAWVWRVL